MKVYGIPNCNSVKKALDWLKTNQIEVEFHDFKKKGIDEAKLQQWANNVGWEKLVNKKGTTWRQLPAQQQQTVTNQKAAIALMAEKTSVIKRPIIELEGKILVGFDEVEYEKAFKSK